MKDKNNVKQKLEESLSNVKSEEVKKAIAEKIKKLDKPIRK